ncbi:MAG: hypothetical protein JNJ45_01205 [Chthonomonas sp.]|nr:hypothetical protein [Chthonomonas sp.]
MSSLTRFLIAIPAYYLAAILEMNAHRFAIFGVEPQFLLTTGLVFALFGSPAGGATAGAASGILQGALAGANMVAYGISRTIAGFALSFVPRVGVVVRAGVGFVAVFAASLVANLVLIFLAPRPDLSSALGSTITSAIYNGVIATPFCALFGVAGRQSSR